jgi:hypothetical protein
MSRRGLLLLVLVALLPAAAWAGPSEISALEQQRVLLERHRARLESLLGEQSRRVARLKEQAAGVGRDYQLQAALRESQTLATKLTALRVQLRSATERLRSEYAAAARQASTDGERARYLRLGAQLEKPGQDTRIVTRERARRLDSPEDLDEKADLLQDSEEKVRRQLRQVEVKLAQLENRARVRRHGKALDDNPFVEESPRRTGQARRTTSPNAAANAAGATTAGDAAESGGRNTPPGAKTQTPAPSPAADPSDSFAGASGASGANGGASGANGGATAKAPAAPDGWGRSGSEVIISIRDVMDPAILKDPKLGGKDLDLKGHINALRKASARLRQVAGQLSHQTKDLRQRAKSLRTQK